eukprot:CAMPEP_0182470078 /NCGR_PEP_ID=MMETSP1319-20130603/18123_1 /TAXON_ID=172717 /ORGANISM="Bolidomonas pacifica, Strain RCC208" /LENGTH=329 /DNA_ID=CAMNT_0024670479 /DNA_START=94 /DNA_END=1080 /DNA_ORIENTATION=-
MRPRGTVFSAALVIILLVILGINNERVMLQSKAGEDVATPPPTYLSGTGQLPFKVPPISAKNFPRMKTFKPGGVWPIPTTTNTNTAVKPRILFLCLTRSSTHSKRGAKQFSTWGNVAVQNGHKFVYVVNEPDYESFTAASTGDEGYTFWTPALPAEAKEKDGYKGAQHRFVGALTYFPLDLLGLDASTTWVMLVDDDTFVSPRFLAGWIDTRSDGGEMKVYGEFQCTSKKTLCGGGGVLFSPMALRNLRQLLAPELKKEVQTVGPGITEGSWYYDVWLTLFMRSHPAEFKVSGSESFSTLPPDHRVNVERRKRGIKVITYHHMERYGYE